MGFTPVKKHANKFNYIPRYFDPEKEAFDQRRAELYGERSEDAGREYVPGQYIRTQREARDARRKSAAGGRSNTRIVVLCFVAAIVLLFMYRLYPVIVGALSGTPRAAAATAPAEEEFDPYAPIRIVPNDYKPQ